MRGMRFCHPAWLPEVIDAHGDGHHDEDTHAQRQVVNKDTTGLELFRREEADYERED